MKLHTLNIAGQTFYGLALPYNEALIDKAKSLKGRWNPKLRLWLFPKSPKTLEAINSIILFSKEDTKPQSAKVPKAYIDQLERRRYSINTIQT